MDDTTQPAPLHTFIAGLDRCLGARAMYNAARDAGYDTTMASIQLARTALGIAKPRNKHDRSAQEAPTALPPITEFPLPSDEDILERLIRKIGLDRAQVVYERVANTFEYIDI